METKEEKLKEKEPEAKKSLMEEMDEEAKKQGSRYETERQLDSKRP